MSYSSARDAFDSAQIKSQDEAIIKLAEGLRELTRAIEHDIKALETKMNNLRVTVR